MSTVVSNPNPFTVFKRKKTNKVKSKPKPKENPYVYKYLTGKILVINKELLININNDLVDNVSKLLLKYKDAFKKSKEMNKASLIEPSRHYLSESVYSLVELDRFLLHSKYKCKICKKRATAIVFTKADILKKGTITNILEEIEAIFDNDEDDWENNEILAPRVCDSEACLNILILKELNNHE